MTDESLRATTENVGFLLARASQRWNERLSAEFRAAGFPEVRPAFGAILLPLFEQDGRRMSDLAAAAGLPKQTLTSLVGATERVGLVERRPEEVDRRAVRVWLTPRGDKFRGVAASALAVIQADLGRALDPHHTRELVQALHQVLELPLNPALDKGTDT